ncbi:MAG: response regulator [Candidatus Saccharibacteria bacterium]
MKKTKKKISIVEDDSAIQQMYATKLSLEGFVVSTADNGLLGLEIISKERPDLVLLDLRMPIMGGLEMLQELRKYEWAANIRIIILTNISKHEAPTELRLLGVDRYIVKAHHTPKQLYEIITEILD